MGPQGEQVVAQMESMGFPRSDIDRAMRAAYFNPDRAIEYLLNVSLRVISFLRRDPLTLSRVFPRPLKPSTEKLPLPLRRQQLLAAAQQRHQQPRQLETMSTSTFSRQQRKLALRNWVEPGAALALQDRG